VRQAMRDAGEPPRGVTLTLRGQIEPMAEMFGGMNAGLLAAILVIFMLLTFYFQSWRLALAVIVTVPAVVLGVALALWLTRTTLNVESFMGAIMAIGIAVANSILLITFAERRRVAGDGLADAAAHGASGRLRPILMTTCAMVVGMVPMSLGLGGGGSQTAPLGRAVIGGLLGGVIATLLILPAGFALLQRQRSATTASIDPDDPQGRYFSPPRPGDGPGAPPDAQGAIDNQPLLPGVVT
jgi:multidrug efflux pump subunit AcrB